MNGSRTQKSIQNVRIALVYYFINLIINFLSRKVFIEYLGTEILGLNTTIVNLLQFLNLAELGIGAAISYTLYEPLANNNKNKINEIVSIQGYMYRRIAGFVIGGAFILMCFFPLIFAKTGLPLWYTYSTFIVLLSGSLAGYYFNYRQIVLTADQKEYKITIYVKSITIIKSALQILAIAYLPEGYIWWLCLEFIAVISMTTAVNRLIKREYPWLSARAKTGKELKGKYTGIIQKTKQLFFHKVGSYVLTQTSPVVIYAYTTLTMVAIYGNYMLIIMGIIALLAAIFNSISAGVGNLVASSNKKHILKVFEELFCSRFLFTGTACYCTYKLAPAFITLWVGSEYLLDNLSLAIMVAIMYINLIRTVVDSFINAYGLFQDIWAPVVEALLNIGLSILLGYWWGISGILCGVLISLLLIVFTWKPVFLFRKGFQASIRSYIYLYIKSILALLITTGLAVYISSRFISIDPASSYANFILYAALTGGIFFILLFALLYLFNKGTRDFTKRIIRSCTYI
ncbi:sugar transporter [Parabacteroides sp.]